MKSSRLSNLVVPRAEAEQKIRTQIKEGYQIRNLPIQNKKELERAQVERSKWSKYNAELLTRLFDSPYFAEEFTEVGPVVASVTRAFPLEEDARLEELSLARELEDFNKGTDDSTARLESILDRLALIPEVYVETSSPTNLKRVQSRTSDNKPLPAWTVLVIASLSVIVIIASLFVVKLPYPWNWLIPLACLALTSVTGFLANLRSLFGEQPAPKPPVGTTEQHTDMDGSELTDTEKELLLAAAKKGEFHLLSVNQIPGKWVRAGGKNFVDRQDPAYAARYREALQSLCDRGYVAQESKTYFVFTGAGFRRAEESANE